MKKVLEPGNRHLQGINFFVCACAACGEKQEILQPNCIRPITAGPVEGYWILKSAALNRRRIRGGTPLQHRPIRTCRKKYRLSQGTIPMLPHGGLLVNVP